MAFRSGPRKKETVEVARMRRKPTASRSMLRPDPRYGNRLVSKFINCMMWDGKKATATAIFYGAMDEIIRRNQGKLAEGEELEIFLQAVDNVKPYVEIRSKRVGGATYQVPVKVSPERQLALALRWLIGVARSKKGRPMHLKLADELLAAYRREGEAMSKRENMHRMAEANKAFAHFAV